MMNEMIARAEATAAESDYPASQSSNSAASHSNSGPRQIEISDDSGALTTEERQAAALRKEVEHLRDELKKLK